VVVIELILYMALGVGLWGGLNTLRSFGVVQSSRLIDHWNGLATHAPPQPKLFFYLMVNL
jgi:hypothetical protein